MDALLTTDDLFGALTDADTGGGYFTKGCAHEKVLDADPRSDKSLKEEPSAALAQRFASGIEFEENVFALLSNVTGCVQIADADAVAAEMAAEQLAAQGHTPGDDSYSDQLDALKLSFVDACKRDQERSTLAAMSSGVKIVLGGRLPRTGRRVGKPDVLVRYGSAPQPNGKWGYVPVDVKWHRALEGKAAERAWPVSEFVDPRIEAAQVQLIGEGRPHLKDSLQLVHYVHMLRELGFWPEGLEPTGAIIGREMRVVWYPLTEALYRYDDPRTNESALRSAWDVEALEWSFRWEAIAMVKLRARGEEVASLTAPELKSECGDCAWRTVCHDDLTDRDHPTLTIGVTPTVARKLASAGVTTRRDLSKLDPRTAALVAADVPVARLQAAAASFAPGDPASVLVGNAPKRAATLAAAGIATVADVLALDAGTGAVPKVAGLVDMIDASRAQKVGKVLRARGVSKLSLPRADIEVDVDMENDSTLNEEDNELGVVYLWGTLTTVRCKGFSLPGNPYRAFSTFAAGDREGEAKAFADMWGWLQSLITLARTEGLTFRSYCYTGAENRIMRHLAKKHHGRFPGVPSLAEVEAFVASEHWVDLYTVVERQLVWPTENRSIKSIAKWARHSWRDSDANGANSVVWYHEACQGDVQAQQRLLDYNEDDVLATFRVREWLDSLCASRASDRLPAAESLDRRFARSR